MKAIRTVILAAALTASASAFAQAPPQEPASKKTWGTVQSVERTRDGALLTLQTSSGTRRLQVPSAPVSVTDVQGRQSGLDGLSEGDWVRVDFQALGAGSPQERDWVTGIQDLSRPASGAETAVPTRP